MQRAVSREGAEIDLEGEAGASRTRDDVRSFLPVHSTVRPHRRDQSRAEDVPATVRWHTWDLTQNRYPPVGGVRLFPTGLIDPADASMFAALASTGARGPRAVVRRSRHFIPGDRHRGGADRQSISKVASDSLNSVSCASSTTAASVLYSTDLLSRKREANLWPGCRLRGAVLRRLMKKASRPNSCDGKKPRLLVRFGTGATPSLLEFPWTRNATAWKTTA